ncbi:hypothetical protein T11_11933 [Trichinella zimbabwensis]|uniref:Uncharacterized protein n=1 Tax=Trichinella zimbabwensis TaxID=268475 RepID=A0A0V1DQV8_9BILA|nr:hypothetical protein T11_11933 [Trichinella zimbabwensis]
MTAPEKQMLQLDLLLLLTDGSTDSGQQGNSQLS